MVVLLEACGHYFGKGGVAKRLDRFLAHLQRYLLSKPAPPLDVTLDLQVLVFLMGQIHGSIVHTWKLHCFRQPPPVALSCSLVMLSWPFLHSVCYTVEVKDCTPTRVSHALWPTGGEVVCVESQNPARGTKCVFCCRPQDLLESLRPRLELHHSYEGAAAAVDALEAAEAAAQRSRGGLAAIAEDGGGGEGDDSGSEEGGSEDEGVLKWRYLQNQKKFHIAGVW